MLICPVQMRVFSYFICNASYMDRAFCRLKFEQFYFKSVMYSNISTFTLSLFIFCINTFNGGKKGIILPQSSIDCSQPINLNHFLSSVIWLLLYSDIIFHLFWLVDINFFFVFFYIFFLSIQCIETIHPKVVNWHKKNMK